MVSKVMITKINKVGLVVDISIAKSLGSGLTSGRDKVKCRYDAGFNSQAEAWFSFNDLKNFVTVVKTVEKTKEEIDVEKIDKALVEIKTEPWKEAPKGLREAVEDEGEFKIPINEVEEDLQPMQGEQLPEVVKGEDKISELPEDKTPPQVGETDFQG